MLGTAALAELPLATLPATGTATYTATGALQVGPATASGSATFTKPTYTGSGTLVVGAATVSGSATFAVFTYTATGALTTVPAVLSGSATFTKPTYTATGALVAPAVTASGSATFTKPTYSATGALSVPPVAASGAALFTRPTYTGTGTLSVAPATASGSAIFAAQVVVASGVLLGPATVLAGTAAFTLPTRTASGALVVAAARLAGTARTEGTTGTAVAWVLAEPGLLVSLAVAAETRSLSEQGLRTVLSCEVNSMGQTLTIGTLTKAAADRIRVACDFGNEPLLIAGNTIVSQNVTTSGGGAPTVSSIQLEDGYLVTAVVDGGSAGDYDLVFSVTLDDSDSSELTRTAPLKNL